MDATAAADRKARLKGFEGLVTLVTDGDSEIAEIRRVLAQSRASTPAVPVRASVARRLLRAGRATMADSKSRRAVIIVSLLAVIAGAVIYENLTSENGKSGERQVPTQPTAPAEGVQRAENPPSHSSTFSAPVDAESEPPQGTDLVLNAGQLRYCLSEKIRLDAAHAAVPATSRYAVTWYNLAVDDYNSRCAQFRYPKSLWNPVQAAVESDRDSLNAQGQERAQGWLARRNR